MSDPEVERLLEKARRRMARDEASRSAPSGPSEREPRRAGSGWRTRLLRPRATAILTRRYVDLKIGDGWGTAIGILQAPLIGLIVGLAFDGQREGLRLDFVLVMVAVWFGVFDSCRELVKERLIILRERRMGVPARAAVFSKLTVLAFLSGLQCVLLLAVVARFVRFDVALPLAFVVLWTASVASVALGLFLSALVERQNSLIALVPIALIPQLVFSDVLIPNPPRLVERLEWLIPATWGLDALRALGGSEPDWSQAAVDLLASSGLGLAFLVLAVAFLRGQDE